MKMLFITLAAALLAGCQTQPVLTQEEIKQIRADARAGLPGPTYASPDKNNAAIMIWLDAHNAPPPPPTLNQIKGMDDDSLCGEFGKNHDDAAAEEIGRRKLFSDSEWATIKARNVNVGMSSRAVLASWGWPDHINSTKTAGGESDQWCYDRFPTDSFGIESKKEFVYIDEHGFVEAVQQ